MEFKLNAEQQLLQDSVRRFVDKACGFDARTAQLRDGDDLRHWKDMAANGWLAAVLPEAYGGLGGSVADTALIAQQLGRGLLVEPYLGNGVLAPQTLLAAASEDQKTTLLPVIADGARRLALAYSEPGTRSNPALATTRAEAQDGGYRLTGRKTLVLGGAGADAYLVSAVTGDDAGISLFLVDATSAGLTVTVLPLHDGSQAAELSLDGVSVPAANLVGAIGAGLPALRTGIAHGIAALCAELVGGMERAIEMTAEYLKVRQQFGVAIGTFQALQHRMSDMAADHELARSMLYALLAALENDAPAQRDTIASQAKSLIGRLAKTVCGQAIQLHGGIGMTEECAVGHYFKRAIVADALLGSADQHDMACMQALQAAA
jgi:alkylation response protein AidB-like acyl-CoA dehydrogenase